MKKVLFDSWNPVQRKGKASRNTFQPFSFAEDSAHQVHGHPELYEVRRDLVFTVLTQYGYGERHSARAQENADKALLALVAKPFIEQASVVLNNIYARDLDGSIAEMEKLLALLTEGQTVLDAEPPNA